MLLAFPPELLACSCFQIQLRILVKKISPNVERDKKALEKLSSFDWKIIIAWECELKREKIDNTLKALIDSIKELQ
jgi:G:T-mismatch repair DNA endonuclease (very short patch repair protein)